MTFENPSSQENTATTWAFTPDSGRHFAAIPVSNRMVDYTEAYKISAEEYATFLADQSAAVAFVESCRRHEQDDRLFLAPGTDRGTPR